MSVIPYLTVPDAIAAIAYYVDALGAVEQFRLPGQDPKKTMHAVLEVPGGTIFLADMGPPEKPAAVAINLGLDSAKAVNELAARLAKHGATINHGPEDMFWGDRFAEITDPFGHHWILTAPKDS
jgi:PhnB protein